MRKTAETVITQAIIETMRSTPTGERGRRVIRDLDEAGYAIVRKPTVGLVAILDAEGERAIREVAASPQADDPHIVGFYERPHPEANPATDVLDLGAGYFAQDGKITRYPADLVQDWLATMAALPLDPAARPTGEDIAAVVLMPDGTAIPMTNEEFKERAEYRDGSMLVQGATYELPPGTEIRCLAPIEDESDRRTEHMTFDEDRDGWMVTGPSDDVARVLDLVKKCEAAEAASKVSAATDPRARAVMDIVESKRLVAKAEAILGSEAVDEILSWLPDVAEPTSRAA